MSSPGFRRQATTLFSAIVGILVVLVILQLWLLTASLDSVLAGDVGPAIAGTIGSAILFAIGAGLLGYVFRLDREARRADRPLTPPRA